MQGCTVQVETVGLHGKTVPNTVFVLSQWRLAVLCWLDGLPFELSLGVSCVTGQHKDCPRGLVWYPT